MSLSDRISALSPTQRALLEVLRKKQTSERPRPAAPAPVSRRPPGDAWPLAIDQERLWFVHQLDPTDVSYNLGTAARMAGALDIPALAAGLAEVIRRHEAWRTTFPSPEGRPVQVIAAPGPVPLPVIDLGGLPEPAREPEARRIGRVSVRRPFDLARGPLLRAWLVRLAPEAHHCLLTVHHIVSDAVSLHIFWGELTALYRAFTAGRPSPLPEPPVQYADFAVWQREQLGGEELQSHVEYWEGLLADALPALDLPTDRPRPTHFTTRGRRLPFDLPSQGIKALARRERMTPFMVLLALLQALLARQAGQEKVVVASPNLNRNRRELEGLLGFFLTQLVFYTDLGGDPTFRELLARVRQVALGAYAHQDLPFGRLVQALRPERDTSRPPLAQVELSVLDGSSAELDLPGLNVSPLPMEDPGASAFELTLVLWDTEEGFRGYFEHNTDLFDATTVLRWAEDLRALAGAAVADPGARLSALPVESAAARHLVLAEWNDTGPGSASPGQATGSASLLHGRFLEQAKRVPGEVAVVDGDERWTYRELADRAAALADRLRRMGIGPEVRVGVCLPRSGEMVASLLGILEAGAAYVPLDPAYPRERLNLLVEDSGAAAVVATAELAERLGGRIACIPPGVETPGFTPAPPAGALLPSPENLAYLIYTSGSTGRPKAVGVTHRSAAALVGWAAERFGGEAARSVLASTSINFDISVFEIFVPLSCGGRVILAENALALPELPAAAEVGLVNTVPSAMAELLRTGGLPPSVRTVNLAGEALSRRLAEAVHGLPGVERLWNLYGPTEDTVYSTAARVLPGAAGEPAIGRPVAGTRAFLLDRDLRPVPLGARGELCLAGEGLARGYLGRPDLTAERFVPDPLAESPGGRLYRTGDLARWRTHGELEHLGRIDRQVKIRGFRIEPGEVEAALATLPGVREAAVVARDGRLAAYVVPAEEPESGADGASLLAGLRGALAERLPAHMIPALWATLPELPLTPNGKVDRGALPAPDARAGTGEHAAPRTPAEEKLAAVWAEVLGVSQVGIHDNFFRLGGDSILSIQMVARARREGLAITPKQLFERQTVAELAAVATVLGGEVAPEKGPVTGEAPLTPIQRWFLDSGPEEPWHFNQAVLLEVRGEVDAPALRRAFAAVIGHHDALRLVLTPRPPLPSPPHRPGEGEPPPAPSGNDLEARRNIANILPPLPGEGGAMGEGGRGGEVLRLDLSTLPVPLQALEAAAAQVQASLDLRNGPLLRTALFDLGAERRLLIAIHHLVVDGVSWRILLEDLETAYGQAREGRPVVLPPKTTSWKRWAERIAGMARSPRVRAEMDSWLALPPAPPLPVDFPVGGPGGTLAGKDTEASAALVSVSLSPEATRALLGEAPAAYHARTDDLLLTALARAFARWTGSPRLRLDLEGHGREEELVLPGADLSRTVGWFTSIFPVVLDLEGTGGPGDALKRVKERLRAVPSRGLGFGLLRYLGEPEDAARLAALPPSEVVFNYLGQLDRVLGGSGFFAPATGPAGPVRSPRARRRHLLEINAEVLGGTLNVHWSYSSSLHERATVETLARGFAGELEALVAHCLSPEAGGWTPSDFPLAGLGQEALDRLLGNDRTVQDLYPLSPMQEGLLFHALLTPGSEVYFEQLTCTIRGGLDTEAFRRAWQRLVDRHGILRTEFLHEGLDGPLQLVRHGVEIPWTEEDWRGEADPDERLRVFAESDRQRGFDLSRAPLLRAALLRTAGREHRFVWSFHHLLLDGWSLPRVFGEVFALYVAERRQGAEAPVLAPALSYRDFIAWLAGRDRAADERYWRQALDGFDAPTPLPWDRQAPPAVRAVDFAQRELALPATATAALDSLARERALTVNTLVQGAWGLLLSRWSGERDVAFGAVIAGRPPELPGVESALGLFINTLPLRLRIDPAAPAAGWLAGVQQRVVEMRQHEQTPLAQVQSWSWVPAGEPLFHSLLVFENYPVDASLAERSPDGLELTDLRMTERTGYPLSLSVLPGRSLRLRLTGDRRFEPVTLQRLLDQLARLLAGIAAGPERPLADLGLLSAAELHQLLVEQNDTAGRETETDVLRRFEEQVAKTPEAEAARDGVESLTFAELEGRAEGLAAQLRELGIGPGSRVALAAGRSAAVLVGMLGTWKAGAAWIPLDPTYPKERLAAMLRDSGAAALVAAQEDLEALPKIDLPVVSPSAHLPPLPVGGRAMGEGGRGGEGSAYLLYTSGSTGEPKGVVVEHRSLAAYLAWVQDVLLPPEAGSIPVVTRLTFDASLKQLLGPLLAGRTVHILPEETATQPAALARSLEEGGHGVLNCIPSLWSAVLEAIEEGEAPVPRRLRRLLLGGEALPPGLLARTAARLPEVEVWNLYGPTEATANAAAARLAPGGPIILGRPIAGTRAYELDPDGHPVPPGAAGELCLGGAGLARGYHYRPGLTAERFVPDPFSSAPGDRLYRTGDLARRRADGTLEFLGRTDQQVKVRGFRIEPGEVEETLVRHPGVREAAVAAREVAPGDSRLVAWVAGEVPAAELRAFLEETLPSPMIPSAFVALPALPRTATGKLDRRALPPPQTARGAASAAGETPRTETERAIAAIWRDVLGVEHVGVHDNFFDLGGHSLLLMRVHGRLRRDLGADLPLVDLFRYPDVASLARRLRRETAGQPAPAAREAPRQVSREIAIVGMAGRFPGAPDLKSFWRNLREGRESISFFTAEEMRAAGVPEEMIGNPAHVPARGVLDEADRFDAALFDYSPREAELTDPQHRLFLECALEALESSGYDPAREGLRIGVWAGTSISTYGVGNLFTNPELLASTPSLSLMVGNDKDFLATRVSYKLDLRGPAMTVQTACSTSLVAVHEACRSLLAGECEMALAGGVSVLFPQKGGYLYLETGIESPDGHCRSFDARAGGTVGGDGVGVVVLRPLAAALADGDSIRAVILGSAINNDGAGKVGYTAPSVDGQARAIAEAHAAAGIDPATVQYVEAHGSATPLGDPIEVAALNQAFGRGAGPGTCALGSVKSNVGHLDAAAGIAGLLKTVLALEHGEIPPSLHFETPNPRIDFASGPFRVHTGLSPWPRNGAPRRAGVSSFGLGGTNVHVVLEEAPAPGPETASARPWQLLVLSARTDSALERATDRLARQLEDHPGESLGDVAWTLQAGRRGWERRRALVCRSADEAARALAERDPRRLLTGVRWPGDRPVAFVFPGLGDQYPGMGAGLYGEEPVFREELDRCAEILLPRLGRDLRELLRLETGELAGGGRPDLRRMLGRGGERSAGDLSRAAIAQPAVFAVEYALAKLWMSWGVRPQAVIGYSLGEYVAACLAGVLSLEDALLLVAERARWIDELPAGSMLAVGLPEAEVGPRLGRDLSLAVVHGAGTCVVAGPPAAVSDLQARLTARGVPCRPVETSHAFHSRMMLPVAPRLAELARGIERRPPRILLLSNVTGGWMTAADAADPEHWSRHLCGPVRFAEGLTELWREPARILLEVGPGGSLTSLALQHLATLDGLAEGDRAAVRSLPSVHEAGGDGSERAFLLQSLAKLWIAGVEVDWKGVHAGESRKRVPLPGYPFERQRYWVEPRRTGRTEDWALTPPPPLPLPGGEGSGGRPWLIFTDTLGLGAHFARQLASRGTAPALVAPGETFARNGDRSWTVRPGSRDDCAAVLDALGAPPSHVLHLWGLSDGALDGSSFDRLERSEELGFRSVLPLLRELAAREGGAPVRLLVAADGLFRVRDGEGVDPGKSSLPGLCQTAAKETPGLLCRAVDLRPPAVREGWAETLAERLLAEAMHGEEPAVAWRGEERWARRPAGREAAPVVMTGPALEAGATQGPFTGHARPNLRNAYVPPEGDLEVSIAGMWQALLGIEAVGRHDSFFEMGGHSLLATSLMARLRESFGVALPIAALFEHSTVAELAALVARRRSEGDLGFSADAALPVVVPDPEHRFEPFPLTDIQQAYWLGRSEELELGGIGSHIYFEFDAARLDLGRMTRALRCAIGRHEMLRAVVLPDGRQRILPQVPPYEIATIDLAGLDPARKEAALLEIRAGMSHQVLRPDRWPLFEVRASRIDGQRTRLHLSLDVLIGDGWSFQLLFRELALLHGDPEAALPPLGLSFRDYVLAEAAQQETEAWLRSLVYWRERVPDLPPAPELPLAKAPASLAKPRFRRWTDRFDAASWRRLKKRGSRAGLTPSGLLLAAFSEVLAAWSKSPRFTITLTLFNRLPVHPQVNEIVGDFTTLTLLAVDHRAGDGFEARARAVQEQLWQDLEHRAVSGVRVLRELARVHGHHVLQPVVFTSTLNVRQESGEEPGFEPSLGPEIELAYGLSQTPQVWLDLQVGELDGELGFNWDVVEELFPAGMVDAMWEAYRGLLRRLADDDSAWTAGRLRLLPAEQLAVRERVNATAVAVPELAGERLHTLVARRAAEQPERPAVLAPDQTLTHGELLRLSSRLGRHLRALGARPNTLVAVVQEKGWEQAVSVLGVLAAGAAYLPIEPGLPRERIHHLLDRGEVEIAVTTPALETALDWPKGVCRVVLDADGTGLPEDGSPLDPLQEATDLAYVIFTSGSTGQPKGVMIDHRGAINTVLDVNRTWGIGPDDRVLALSSLSFDLSVYDLFGTLAAGGAVVFPRAEAQRDPAHWAERIGSERVTVWNSVPALLALLVDFLESTDTPFDSPLRLALLSGDWIPLDLPDRVRALSPRTQVVSLGGATEASIWSIRYPVAEVDPAWKSIPYGRPMANQTFHVLDGRFEPKPDWVPGQLWIGGLGVAQGYWRDAEKTAASFVLHPETGERLYRTGDLGRWLPGGNIELLGREDFQVKVQGYRIELGEIETALGEHPSVRAAVVAAVGERLGAKRLVAYVVPNAPSRPDADPEALTGELRAWLRERLPEYMVPALFVTIDALPLGPTGKVDRRALPAPEQALAQRSREHRPPRTGTEKSLAGIWSEVLDVPAGRIGLGDNFYELGGDSLLATRILARVRDALGVDLPLQTFFEAVTLETLAEAADRARSEGESDTERLARLAEQLQNASPEEVERMLAELGPAAT